MTMDHDLDPRVRTPAAPGVVKSFRKTLSLSDISSGSWAPAAEYPLVWHLSCGIARLSTFQAAVVAVRGMVTGAGGGAGNRGLHSGLSCTLGCGGCSQCCTCHGPLWRAVRTLSCRNGYQCTCAPVLVLQG